MRSFEQLVGLLRDGDRSHDDPGKIVGAFYREELQLL